MLTGEIRSQIDAIWNSFWTGGIANPLEVMEQITYLLFLRRLDDLHTLEENKSVRLGKPMGRRTIQRAGGDPDGVVKECVQREVDGEAGEDGVGAAEGDDGRAGEEQALVDEDAGAAVEQAGDADDDGEWDREERQGDERGDSQADERGVPEAILGDADDGLDDDGDDGRGKSEEQGLDQGGVTERPSGRRSTTILIGGLIHWFAPMALAALAFGRSSIFVVRRRPGADGRRLLDVLPRTDG